LQFHASLLCSFLQLRQRHPFLLAAFCSSDNPSIPRLWSNSDCKWDAFWVA
jgi:hypothetical protein